MLHKILGYVSTIVGGILALFSLPWTFSYINAVLIILSTILIISGVKIIKGSRSQIIAGLSIFALMITFILAVLFLYLLVIAGIIISHPNFG